jgi:hypothetical protein
MVIPHRPDTLQPPSDIKSLEIPLKFEFKFKLKPGTSHCPGFQNLSTPSIFNSDHLRHRASGHGFVYKPSTTSQNPITSDATKNTSWSKLRPYWKLGLETCQRQPPLPPASDHQSDIFPLPTDQSYTSRKNRNIPNSLDHPIGQKIDILFNSAMHIQQYTKNCNICFKNHNFLHASNLWYCFKV